MPARPQRLVRAKAAKTYLGKQVKLPTAKLEWFPLVAGRHIIACAPPLRISEMAFGFQLLLGFRI
jgi:hypothetical protein